MSLGKPTISTPLEANVKINSNSNNLFASDDEEWFLCINKFIEDSVFYKNEVGAKNKKIVENFYSVEVNYKNYITIFNQISN